MPGGSGSGDCGGSTRTLFGDDGRGGDESDFGTSELQVLRQSEVQISATKPTK